MAVTAGGGNQQNVNLQLNLDNNTQRGLDQAIDDLNEVESSSRSAQSGLDDTSDSMGGLASISLSPMVVGIAAAAAGVALLVKAFGDFKQSSEIIAVTNAQIKRMGFEADLSQKTIDGLVASTRDIESARGAILGLTASTGVDPKLLPELFQLSKTAAQVEQLDLQGVATDLGKALTEISTELPSITGQLLFMTDAQMENARALDLAGKSAEAQAIVIDALRKKYGQIAVDDPGSIFDEMGIAITLVMEKIGGLIGEFLGPFAATIKDIFLDINSFLIDKKRLDLVIDIREAKEKIKELEATLGKGVDDKLLSLEFGVAFKSDFKIQKMISELQAEIEKNESKLKIQTEPTEVKFFVDRELLNAQLNTVENAFESFKATSISLLGDDEQIQQKANKQLAIIKQAALDAVDAQQRADLLIGVNNRQLNANERNALQQRADDNKAFIDEILSLNDARITNQINTNSGLTDIQREFSKAVLAVHKDTEDARTVLSEKAVKERLAKEKFSLKIIDNAFKSFKSTAFSLLDDKEQVQQKADDQIETIKELAVNATREEQKLAILRGKNNRLLTDIEAAELQKRTDLNMEFISKILSLNNDRMINEVITNGGLNDIQREFARAVLAVHTESEKAKTAITKKEIADRIAAEKEQAAALKSIILARSQLEDLSTSLLSKTDQEALTRRKARNVALEKSIALIDAQAKVNDVNTDALKNQAIAYSKLDEASLNDLRLFAMGDELLMINAQIAAIQRLSSAQLFANQMSSDALREQNMLWQNLANDGIQLFSNAIANAFVRERKAIDIIKIGLLSIGQQLIATLIKIGIQQAISAAFGKSIDAGTTASSIALSKLRSQAYASEAASLALATAGVSVGTGVAALTAGVPLAIGLVQPLAGIAHGGLSSVPNTGTFLLQKGEMVSKRQTVDKLDEFISSASPRGRKPVINDISVNVGLNITALDGQSVLQILDDADSKIKSIAIEGLMQFFDAQGVTIDG